MIEEMQQSQLDEDFLDACRTGRTNDVKVFLDRGADLEKRDDNNNGALHLAAKVNAVQILKNLIKSGINPEVRNSDGMTALHLAAWGLHAESSNMLIEAGLDIHARDREHRSPLHFATQLKNNKDRTAMVLLLIAHGAEASHAPMIHRNLSMGQAAIMGKLKERLVNILDQNLSNSMDDEPASLIAYAMRNKVPHFPKEGLQEMAAVIESQQARAAINALLAETKDQKTRKHP